MSDADIVVTPEGENNPAVEALGSKTAHEFIRYFVASLLALSIDVMVLYVLTSMFAVDYLFAGAIAFLLGLTLVYILSITWIFDERSMKNPAAEFMLFAVIGVIGLGINEAVLYVLTDLVHVEYILLAKLASVILVFSWNFIARKYILFSAHRT